jgi:hypothetical protein
MAETLALSLKHLLLGLLGELIDYFVEDLSLTLVIFNSVLKVSNLFFKVSGIPVNEVKVWVKLLLSSMQTHLSDRVIFTLRFFGEPGPQW